MQWIILSIKCFQIGHFKIQLYAISRDKYKTYKMLRVEKGKMYNCGTNVLILYLEIINKKCRKFISDKIYFN